MHIAHLTVPCIYILSINYLWVSQPVVKSEKIKTIFYTYSMHPQQQCDNSPRESTINHVSLSKWKIKTSYHSYQLIFLTFCRYCKVHSPLRPSSTTARSVCLSVSPSLSLPLYPSHFTQEWGYLSDTASMEKISFSTINCESDRRKRREGSGEGRRPWEERERGKGTSAHDRSRDVKLKTNICTHF